jgi:hypothetical protein
VTERRKDPDPAKLEASVLAFDQARQARENDQLPPIDFATFLLSLSHSARVHLGDAPNPLDGKSDQNLSLARQTIDLIALLQEKTKGNLTGEEEHVIDQTLYDLRMRYVEVVKRQ